MVRGDRKRGSVELRANAEGGGASCEKVKGSACQNGARMLERRSRGSASAWCGGNRKHCARKFRRNYMKRIGSLTLAALLGVAAWYAGPGLRGTPQQAFAQAVVPITDGGSDAYKVSYFDVSSAFVKTSSGYGGVGSSGGSGDALLRIVDAGNWEGGNAGDVCANIYVFNDTQEEAECCSCPLTANSLMTFSVINQLTRNPFSKTTESLSAGVIKIVGSKGAPCVTGCFATTAQGPYTIAGGLHKWFNHTEWRD